jgi:hypothetical protein
MEGPPDVGPEAGRLATAPPPERVDAESLLERLPQLLAIPRDRNLDGS